MTLASCSWGLTQIIILLMEPSHRDMIIMGGDLYACSFQLSTANFKAFMLRGGEY